MDRIVGELDELIASRRVLLIGEFHGSREFPELTSAIVDAAVAKGLAVTIGLEIPCSEQDQIDSALNTPACQIDGPWWGRAPEFRDGRSSSAMADLVASLAAHRLHGADVAVIAMDGPWVAPGSPVPMELLGQLEVDRDQAMATRLLDAVDLRPRAFTLVLAGNEHTSLAARLPGSPRTLASYVIPWHRDLVSLNGQCSGGATWVLSRGGAGAIAAVDGIEAEPGVAWAASPGDDGHHGYVHVGLVSASRPHAERLGGTEMST